ncbi:MAG: ZIP family metal transporter [Candidatus Aenigmarchaeota archaeon]|nr:ZIP family metal transporter [Candidatus Aenigmarchaeota archaeon]NIP40368.1 ZIP family metal transporter [Candidatus Aenigmarchaeota archaeon]NIQ18294.1 ZIP family metal transporter [Candidatus Aenigmarchaeota archaeon]NIS73246.1 ZIP family metal transporter [Candidatus Aenigmarchaeota archaeon]
MALETFVLILLATVINSFIGLIGVLTLWMRDKSLSKILIILVAFSAGALLSGAFFHLMAESIEVLEAMTAFIYLMIGFIAFFLMERFLHWRHCHEGRCDVHPYTQLVLIGDGIHNFIDGVVIAASFMVSIAFGWVTTLLIILHEIPQELGDFGILVYGGFEKIRALGFNFLAQVTCIIGGFVGFFLLYTPESIAFLLPFAAGGFIYIASSDLIPELHKEENLKKSMLSFVFFIIGIVFLLGIKILVGG